MPSSNAPGTAPPNDSPMKSAGGSRPPSSHEIDDVPAPRSGRSFDTMATAPVVEERLRAGTRAGRYVLLERLGAGGGGVVYAAFDPQLERKVAIKLLPTTTTRAGSESQGHARLLREGQAMARLKHPNVLPVYDVGTFEDGDLQSVFVAMQLVDGGTFRQWLRKRRSRREILDVMMAAGRGLAAAHAAGLVHRDFKPDNVLLDTDGRVFVTDFGIVRAENAPRSDGDGASEPTDLLSTPLTRLDAVVGTPAYMAPEQYRHEAVDARTDQFSFCVTLYEALTGQRPFAGNTYDELKEATLAGRITPAARFGEMPGWLRRVVLRGLEVQPARRYPSMHALLAALADDPAVKRRRALAALAAVGVVALVAAGAVRLASDHQELCKGAERKLEGVWDANVRARMETAFTKTGEPGAPRLARTAGDMLDGYAKRWASMHADACEATRLRGEQPEAVLQLRMACLEDRLHELRTLSGILVEADAALVQKSVDAATALSSLQRCADVAALSAPVPTLTSPEQVRRAEALRARIAAVKALTNTGRAKAMVPETEAIVASARELGDPALLGRALQARGELLGACGEHQVAETALFQAFTAAYAARDDAAAAEIADDLVSVVGYWLARSGEGHRWADVASAAIRRVGGNDELEAWLKRDEAWVDYLEGNAAGAEANAERALQLGRKVLPPDSTRLAKIHSTLASAYRLKRRYAEAVAQSQQALEILRKAYGDEHPSIASALTSLGNTYNEQHRYAEAESCHRRSLAIAEAVNGADHPMTAISHTNLGDALLGLERLDEALTHFHLAEQIATRRLGGDHPTLFNARIGIGSCLYRLHRPKEAIEALRAALAGADKKLLESDTAAEGRFVLARALWDRRDQRAQATSLADQARSDAQRVGKTALVDEIDAWRREHR